MAQLPVFRRILKEDLKEAPEWGIRLLSAINSVFESLYLALSGNITFEQNIRSQIKEITFSTSATYESDSDFDVIQFRRTMPVRASGLFILQIVPATGDTILRAVTADWEDSNGTINVNYISGLIDSTQYLVRFLVI